MNAPDQTAIARAVTGLDGWFETMRVAWPTAGYGGPVIHWWNHCLSYCGTGLDWRYEGIVAGYLTLWRQRGERRWLDKAITAGNDLVGGQLGDGHFTNSRFERNPGEGGAPHEVACDIALLRLARELRHLGDAAAESYFSAARRNLETYWFGRLWDSETMTLRDGIGVDSFVPNKAATFVEAVLLLAELAADDDLVERYGLPTGDRILAMQVRQSGDLLDGAIAQNRLSDRTVASYYPLYIARCIPGLLALAERSGETRYRDGAVAAAQFLVRVRERDGGLPQVLYRGGRRNRYPRWIAGTGDVVRALLLAGEVGADVDPTPTIDWLLQGVRGNGSIATAEGFGRIMPVPWLSKRERFADEIGVVGWCDKAFRALTLLVAPGVRAQETTGRREVTGSEERCAFN